MILELNLLPIASIFIGAAKADLAGSYFGTIGQNMPESSTMFLIGIPAASSIQSHINFPQITVDLSSPFTKPKNTVGQVVGVAMASDLSDIKKIEDFALELPTTSVRIVYLTETGSLLGEVSKEPQAVRFKSLIAILDSDRNSGDYVTYILGGFNCITTGLTCNYLV